VTKPEDVEAEAQLGRELIRNHWLYLFGVMLLGLVLNLLAMVVLGGGG
jgi:hypothetical protein